MMISRRAAISGFATVLLTGCRLYSDLPPVVIGGAAVAKDQPIMAALRASSDHTRLVTALKETGLDKELSGLGPITFFAPNNRAFDLLRPKAIKALIKEDPSLLKQVLLGHIVEARLTSEDLLLAFPQLGGRTKIFSKNKQVIRAQGTAENTRLLDLRNRSVKVQERDAIASNGIIHVVDGMLLPDADAMSSP